MRKIVIVLISAMVMGGSAFAVQMKCGAGKCSKAMQAKPAMKCGGMNKMGKNCNCKKCDKDSNMSMDINRSMQMGGKCGKGMQAKPMNKCGSMQKAKKMKKCGSK